MKIANQTVLLTGAGGFIGSHLAESLVRSGARTKAFVHYNSQGRCGHLDSLPPDVRSEIEVLFGDVRDAQRVRQAADSCQVVFHLAALIGIPYSYLAAQSYVQTNIEGTLNVLTACLEEGVQRLVHTSTSEVYGTPKYTPIDEQHPLRAQSPYAASKVAADQLALSYHASFDLAVTVVRPFNTYGPRQSARAVIPAIIAQALAGGTIRLGATDTLRDFLFVSDTVRGFLAAAEGSDTCGEVVNLGTGSATTIAEVAELVGTILGRPLDIQTDVERQRPAQSEVRQLICSPAKALAMWNWAPEVGLTAGLRHTIEWMEAHRDVYRAAQYAI